MLNREDYRQFISVDKPLVNTGAYARIISAQPGPSGLVWRAVCVYHLPPEVNNRMLIAFCDVLWDSGIWAPVNGMRIAYTWDGKQGGPLYRPFEKVPPEPRAQVDLYKNQVTTIWVDDLRYPSDRVVGIHSAVEDGQGGNSLYHNSFVCLWQLMRAATITPPIDPPVTPPSNSAALAQLAIVQRELDKLRGLLQ